LAYKNFAIIRRPVQRLPASTLKLREHAIALGIRRLNNVEINIVSIPASRSVSQFLAVIRPYWRHIARLAISEQRYVAASIIETIDLEKLVPTDVFRE